MQLEVIGCTSAGKTTLITQLLDNCHRHGVPAVHGEENVVRRFHLGWLRRFAPLGPLVNLTSMLAWPAAWREQSEFLGFSREQLRAQPIGGKERRYLLRNVLKALGTWRHTRAPDARERLQVLDESTVHLAHSLFVHRDAEAPRQALERFVELVPLCDLVMELRQPPELIVSRLLVRGHKRVPRGQPEPARLFVERAMTMFEQLLELLLASGRLRLVERGRWLTLLARGDGAEPPAALVEAWREADAFVAAGTDAAQTPAPAAGAQEPA